MDSTNQTSNKNFQDKGNKKSDVIMREVTLAKIEKYLLTTKTALERISINEKLNPEHKRWAEDFLDMASRYFRDANYYKEKGDFVTAFASVNYAHGWIDSGARLGLFNVKDGSSDFVMPKD